MANQYKNKVVWGGTALIDLTADTVTAENVIEGYVFHSKDGSTQQGTLTHLTDSEIDAITGGSGGGSSVTVEALAVTANGTYTAPDGTAYSPVTVSVPTPAPSLQSKSVTPSTSQQTVQPDSGYDGLSSVTVGATNFVHGEFTTHAGAGVQSVSIPYEGSGYPIMAYVVVKGGAYASGTEWYSAIQRYAVGMWAMSKSVMSSTPTYGTSGAANQGVTCAIYKNSTSSATSYTRTSAMNTNVYSSSNANNAAVTCVRFKGSTSMSVYTNTSSYGLFPETDYEYFIVYSE